MSIVCLVAALLLVVLMSFVSSAQLLYLESLRLLKRESRASSSSGMKQSRALALKPTTERCPFR